MTEVLDSLAEGRQRLAEGREAIALEHLVVASDSAADPESRHEAIALCAEVNLSLGRPYEAIAWTERLRREAPRADRADLLEAVAQLRVGEPAQALALLDRVSVADGYRPSAAHLVRAQALGSLGRTDEAATALTAAMAADPTDAAVWTTLAAACEDLGLDPTPLLPLAADHSFASTFGHLVDARPAGAERVLDALWSVSPGDPRALVLLGYVGSRLSLERALEWSGRLRAHGRGNDCPLLGLAASDERTPVERVRAAAIAWATFADERAGALLDLSATALLDRDLPTALSDVGAFAPDLAGDFLVTAASTPSRALLLAKVLRDGDADETAVSLVRHAVDLASAHVAALPGAVAQTLSAGDVEALATAADHHGDGAVAQALRAAA